MIVADASALIATLFEEPEGDIMLERFLQADLVVMAAPSLFETKMVAMGRTSAAILPKLERLLDAASIEVRPWEEAHVALAFEAFRRFGKGSGHRAQLNFGDCMAYALAKALDVPLLFKGNDFALTDIQSAL